MHSNEYPASQKLGGGADGYHSQYNGGQAPSYVQDVLQNQGDLKPKGKNIKEGGFDSNDPNASFGTDIGSKNDPGRKAERGFQQATAESGPYGSSARSEKGQDNQHWYQPLERDTSA